MPPTASPTATATPSPTAGSGARLLFAEEFSGSALDAARWRTDGNWGMGIGCQDNAGAVSVSGGLLHLYVHAGQTWCPWSQYSESVIQTAGFRDPYPFAFTYGYAEARLRVPPGRGIWPAFWLYDVAGGAGELDIGEWLDHDPTTVYLTVHYPDGSSSTVPFTGPDWAGAFHVIGLDWQPGRLDWYVDGNLVRRVSDSRVPAGAMYVLLDNTVGGWAGDPDSSTPFPSDFQVDYVHVWNKKP
jgi:beta-glucanase (GH16 family)